MARPTPRPSRGSAEQQAAVARRLALLSAELGAVRESAGQLRGGRAGSPGGRDPTRPTSRSTPTSGEGHTAIREAPWVPEPGRHAHRRLRDRMPGLPTLVPATLRGRVSLGPTHLAVVAVLVAVGLAATAWWVLRSEPTTVAVSDPAVPGGALVPGFPTLAPPTTVVPSGDPGAVGTASPSAGAETEVVVDVAGRVRRPGIAVLPPGSRVVDALDAAGGARSGVDLTALNLARVLVDGEQILVGLAAAPGPAASAVSVPGATAPTAGVLVNLNTADQPTLETLPEVGPVTAQAIIAWRDQHGGFTAVDELLEVDGIGEATLGQVAPLVTL